MAFEKYPTRVRYEERGIPRELRFHAVLEESHETNTQVTKFPVQEGFEVSNHAIRLNRKLLLTVMFSNVVTDWTSTVSIPFMNNTYDTEFSNNNIRSAFEQLKWLVQSATLCDIDTNLGSYSNVVFTGVSTSSSAGRMDSMEVKLQGEELQVISSLNNTTPTEVVWEKVPAADVFRAQKIISAATGMPCDTTNIDRAYVMDNDNFTMTLNDATGNPYKFTNTYKGRLADGTVTTQKNIQELNYDGMSFKPPAITELSVFGIPDLGEIGEFVKSKAGGLTDTVNDWRKSKFGGPFVNCLLGGTAAFIDYERLLEDSWFGEKYRELSGHLIAINKFIDGAMNSVLGQCVVAAFPQGAEYAHEVTDLMEEIRANTDPAEVATVLREQQDKATEAAIEAAKEIELLKPFMSDSISKTGGA